LKKKNKFRDSRKILLALSGGVDSAVAAALLKKQGFEVTAVFFRFLGNKEAETSLKKAKKIAKKLDISLKVIDARKEFKKKVIDCFVRDYGNGITPNPCVRCNREMKFKLLFDLLKKMKADCAATGHYASINVRPFPSPKSPGIPQGRTLCEARDKSKDQSYFLYRLTQRELSKIIFPLGEHKKAEVKKLAKKLNLPVLDSRESQDVCFIPGNDLNTYLNKYIKRKPGNIVDESGNILGTHKGLPFYTIGQRRGIEIGGKGPYFVIGKNSRKNELVVSNDSKSLLIKKFELKNVHWINKPTKFPANAKIQTRYHSVKISAKIKKTKGDRWEVKSKVPFRAVTPGQSAVFYQGEEVIGGGIILK
jgi:tRNA-specific 2-thiouridylase